jgi:hypothetical protein
MALIRFQRFRVAISLLLLLCLTPAVAVTDWSAGWAVGLTDSDADRRTLVYTAAFENSVPPTVIVGRRTNLHSCDGPVKTELVVWRIRLSWAGRSVSFHPNSDIPCLHRAERTADFIRGPPSVPA